ncbi:MAG: translocation/assembly module TamB [Bacteroidales bacterium]|nr:translocation/assembly module TamB [Bacteroidales bacterium]
MSRHKNRKKIGRIFMIAYLILFGIPAVVLALIRTPLIQQMIAQRMANYLSKELNTTITIGKIDVDFMLDITMHDFYMEDQHDSVLLKAEELQVSLTDIDINNNSFSFDKVALQNADINLIKYAGEEKLNFNFIQEYFAGQPKESSSKKKSSSLFCNTVELNNCHFKYRDENKDQSNGKINFNNLDIANLSLLIEDITISDTLNSGHLLHLAINEQSGFNIYHMEGLLEFSKKQISGRNLKILCNHSNLNLNLQFTFDNFNSFNHFVDSVNIDAVFMNSKISMGDIAYFAPTLDGMTSSFEISGRAAGFISNLRAGNMLVQSGKNTRLFFDLSMKGLPDFEHTDINFNLKNSTVFVSDLDNFTLPGGEKLNISSQFNAISKAKIKADFIGSILDFQANIIAETNNGFIKADVNSQGKTPNQSYSGTVMFDRFNLSDLAGPNSKLGEVSGNLSFSGNGTNKYNYSIKSDGNITSLFFNEYLYTGIQLDGSVKPGYFEGEFLVNDPNLSMNFDGLIDYSGKQPVLDFISNIEECNLKALHFNRNDSDAWISGLVDVNVEGLNPDSMLGQIKLNNIAYDEGNLNIRVAYLSTNIEKNDSVGKNISVRSDIFKGDISGVFSFAEIGDVVQNYLSIYFPTFISYEKKEDSLQTLAFSYEFTFTNVQEVLDVFTPGLSISNNAIARGSFDSGENYLRAEIAANFTTYNQIDLKNLSILGETFNEKIYFTATSDALTYNDSTSVNQLILNTVTYKDMSDFSLHWDNNEKVDKKQYSADISGNLIFSKGKPLDLQFNESTIVLNDSLYKITETSNIVIDTGYIWIKELTMRSPTQSLTVEGRISKDPYDMVQISFINVQASTFADLIQPYGLVAEGNINGYLLLSNLYKTPDYRSDISITQLNINGNAVGDAVIQSSWDHERQAVYSEAYIEYTGNVGKNVPFEIKGFYNPRDEKEALDLSVKLDRFNLELVAPYLSSFSSHLSGLCDGKIDIKGSLDKPDVNGYISFRRTNIKVDYLNMYYSFANTLTISNSSIAMKDMTINDTHGKTATGDFELKHDHFKDFYLDLSLSADNMQFLNTTVNDNKYFYGKAFASGQVNIYGPLNEIQIDVIAKSEPGTIVYIPVTGSDEVAENNFITFVTSNSDTNRQVDVKTDNHGVRLDLDLEVTSDAEVQIVFDPKVGDIMKGNGNGRLKMTMDENGEFLMFGSLEIEKGEYLFTLENVINKKFIIDKGGIIKWTGDPYGGEMNLIAKYNLKTSLYELMVDPSEIYKAKVPVSCLMHLSGGLLTPDIEFDIDLPNSDENTKNIVRNLIPNTEEMNRQVFSLLILNSFLATSNNTYSNPISQGLGTTSTELLINQFSNWLSQISKDFDIGFNYSQGNEISSSQVEVILSTQLFNDKIVIDGNLGVGGSQVNNGGIPQDQQASNIVGDVSVEYKIDKEGKFRVKAFNRSNTIDVVTNDAPYTQGMAFFYRKDFNRFSELWRRKNKPIENKPE